MDDDRAKQLLARVARQDQAAFAELYKGYSRRVHAYALNLLRDPGRAEEVLVDTMHEVWRHAARFRGDSRCSTWVIGIARHKALLAIRGRRPDETHADLDDLADVVPDDDAAEGHALLAQKQRAAGVRRCMDKLSDEHRDCLHLVYYEGCALGEVAALQAVPENTVKTRLFHARQRMRNCLRLLIESEGAEPGARP